MLRLCSSSHRNILTHHVTSAAMEASPQSEATESARRSHMVMQWGQLVDHDVLATAGEFFDCCQRDIK